MDEKDIELLRLLQEDCKRSMKELSKRLGLPISTVYTRIKRLEKEGVIKGYTALIDEKKLGYGVRAFILISYAPTKVSQIEVAKKLAEFPQVLGVYIITGEWDIILEVIEKDVESLGEFVVNKLRSIKGVDKTLTMAVLKRVKDERKILTYAKYNVSKWKD